MSDILENILSTIEENCKINDGLIKFEQIQISVKPDELIFTLEFLKDNDICQFRQLTDIAGVDFPERANRFDIIYHFLSFKNNVRIRVKTEISENESIQSIIPIFPAANWFEREAFDMYGIHFKGHPDLRRILTDYGFEGYPLRKDFPLTGNVEVRYDEMEKKIIYEPVKLQQDYRNFDIQSPWEGTKYTEKKDKD
jgi:NADH-quinone oxidoreductase subunit C|tara:strand:+ start:899 stop:1486 length:588 start_codon:yes stop_codon:yes gene_type:complete